MLLGEVSEAQANYQQALTGHTTSAEDLEPLLQDIRDAQDRYNQAVNGGATSQEKLAALLLDVEQAHNATEIAVGGHEKAVNNLAMAETDFYTQVIPQTIATIAGLVGGLGQLTGAISKVSTGIPSIGAAVSGIAGGFTIFLGIMRAIDENILGIKDKPDQFNQKAQEVIPQLAGVFESMGANFASNVKGFADISRAFEEMIRTIAEGRAGEALAADIWRSPKSFYRNH